MKILLIHTSMSGGGIQSVVCHLANELSRKDVEVSVCSISQPSDDDIFWKKLNENICKFSLGKKGGGFSFAIVYKIYKFLRNNKYDIVHIHGFFCYYLLSVFLLHKQIRFIYTIHSDAYQENGKWDKRFIIVKKLFFKIGWIIPITISEASQESFFKLYGCESVLIHNGIPKPLLEKVSDIDISKYRVTPNTKLFIHAGRIDVPKNQIVLCKVFQRLINEGNDVALVIAGGVTSTEIFKGLYPLFNDRIVYLGPRDDIVSLMSQCDAMCLPSLWEGFPIVLLEALSVGCIPICSPVGGIVNVITDGENGILSKSSSYDDYYSAVKCFLELPDTKRNNICLKSKESFLHYTADKMAQNYLNVYQK